MNETAALDWNAIIVAHIKDDNTFSLSLSILCSGAYKWRTHSPTTAWKEKRGKKTRKSHKGDKINWEKKKVMTIYYKKRQPN